ncbi:hypothetical protein RJ640_008240 [Escallonia rubra]|uniref:Uncharacterized protein n=1 Tax=Escallonia rubra TaxID=112253 RepID=A0AA88U1N2_9ASTE|nr:hypothetical protein RJ640_008240 [Escallonia rubra]
MQVCGAMSMPCCRCSTMCTQQRKGQILAVVGRLNAGGRNTTYPVPKTSSRPAIVGLAAAAAVIFSAVVGASAVEIQNQSEAETLLNIPPTLSGECASGQPLDCKKARIQRPKSRKAESCTIKCVTTCIRGGEGSPGEGPLNVRRPLVVFKQGFRSRQY